MRLLIVTHNYPRFEGDPAGAFVARLARGASAAGIETRVLAPHAAGLEERSTSDGVSLTRFRYAPELLERVAYRGDLHRSPAMSVLALLGVPAFLGGLVRAVRSEVRSFRPDVIHAHWWMPSGWIATRTGVPAIITCHGSDVRLLDRAPFRVLARDVFARATIITAVSRFLARDLATAMPGAIAEVRVTPMPVDLEQFAVGSRTERVSPPRILYAGNLVASKGVDVLLRALRVLRDAGTDAHLKVLGEGPALGELRALARHLQLESFVQWSEFVTQREMPGEYGAATVTALPTRGNAEGLGLALVEALASGCAVVGTSAGGIPEVIEHEVTGLLARDGDADDLAAQLARVINDRALRERLVAAGQLRVRQTYSAASATGKFLALYDAIASRRHAA